MTESRMLKIELEEDFVDLIVHYLSEKNQELEKLMYVLSNDMNDADGQINHKSNPPIVRDAWVQVRNDAMAELHKLQGMYDTFSMAIEAMTYSKNNR